MKNTIVVVLVVVERNETKRNETIFSDSNTTKTKKRFLEKRNRKVDSTRNSENR